MSIILRILLSILFAPLLIQQVIANEIVLSGTYQGIDLFVQNPYNRQKQKFCTHQVFINDRMVLQNPSLSAFKIDLSHLQTGDLVVVRIIYDEGCEPSIVNKDALKKTDIFQYLSVQVDLNSVTWTVQGDKGAGRYYLEHKWKDKGWNVVDSVDAQAKFSVSKYALSPNHKKGLNSYRLYYLVDEQEKIYSMEFDFTASDNYITFFPKVATTNLTLSDSTQFTIEDLFGKVLKKGNGKTIAVNGLKPGKYYIVIQNRKEQFIKR